MHDAVSAGLLREAFPVAPLLSALQEEPQNR